MTDKSTNTLLQAIAVTIETEYAFLTANGNYNDILEIFNMKINRYKKK